MTKTRKLGVIAAVTILSALTLPRSSTAQTPEGFWSGIESFTTETFHENMPPTFSSGTGPAVLDLLSFGGFPNYSMSLFGNFPGGSFFISGRLSPADAFGPTSATASGPLMPVPSRTGLPGGRSGRRSR